MSLCLEASNWCEIMNPAKRTWDAVSLASLLTDFNWIAPFHAERIEAILRVRVNRHTVPWCPMLTQRCGCVHSTFYKNGLGKSSIIHAPGIENSPPSVQPFNFVVAAVTCWVHACPILLCFTVPPSGPSFTLLPIRTSVHPGIRNTTPLMRMC